MHAICIWCTTTECNQNMQCYADCRSRHSKPIDNVAVVSLCEITSATTCTQGPPKPTVCVCVSSLSWVYQCLWCLCVCICVVHSNATFRFRLLILNIQLCTMMHDCNERGRQRWLIHSESGLQRTWKTTIATYTPTPAPLVTCRTSLWRHMSMRIATTVQQVKCISSSTTIGVEYIHPHGLVNWHRNMASQIVESNVGMYRGYTYIYICVYICV